MSGLRASSNKEMDMEDGDVKAERLAVNKGERNDSIIKTRDLSKDFSTCFKQIRAVDRVTVGIREGEVGAPGGSFSYKASKR